MPLPAASTKPMQVALDKYLITIIKLHRNEEKQQPNMVFLKT